MIPRTPWLERRFETGLPLEMFPELLGRLRRTPARIQELFAGVDPDVLTVRNDGAWSILDNVGHLLQVEGLWEERLDDFEARRQELTPARFESRRVDAAQFNRRAARDLSSCFRVARGHLVARLERLGDDVLEAVARHPRLDQPMRVVDLMFFIAEHDDHHLATIGELLASPRSAPPDSPAEA